MNYNDVVRLVAHVADTWQRADLDAIAAPFCADGWFITPGRRWQGPVAIRQAAADFFGRERDAIIRIERILWDAERSEGAVEWVWSAIDEAGRRYEDEDGVLFALDDTGQIRYWREYFNLSSRRYLDKLTDNQ